MPTFSSQGLSVHFMESGGGAPVVLLHSGGGSSSAQWRKISPLLEDRFRLLAPDLIGAGKTDAWDGSERLSHDHQAALVRDLIAHAADKGPVHVVGHSYGGATALRLAFAHGDLIRRLVLIEPIMTPLLRSAGEAALYAELEAIAEQFIAVSSNTEAQTAWHRFLDYRNGKGTWANLSDTARSRILAQTAQTVAGFRANLNNPTTLDDLKSLNLPTLVLCGAETTAPDRRISEIVGDHIPGCGFQIITGAEHMLPVTHPEPVAEAVRAHLLAEGD